MIDIFPKILNFNQFFSQTSTNSFSSGGRTRAQNRKFSPKAISDQGGETGCFETWDHTACANEPSVSLV